MKKGCEAAEMRVEMSHQPIEITITEKSAY